MPAVSKKQQKFMGIVRSIQKGEQPASEFSKDAQDAAKDMKKSSVKKFAKTKHKGLPTKVKKEDILNKLKETIKEELKDYTYGSGDIVKDVNPSCPHHGAMGKVKSVNPKSVVFVVMNKGKNFKPGMELEKSHDQMKKMNESLNEMSAKSKKIINKLNKKEKEMFMDMVDMMGFDQVMMDYKKDKKAFKQALKDMTEGFASAAQRRASFASGYEAKGKKKKKKESVNEASLSKVSNGVEFSKRFLQGLDLVIKQAQGLKGPLAKHPVKRDLNKLKAVQTLFKRFLQPEINAYKFNLEAPDINDIKKGLSSGKFASVIEYNLKVAIEQDGFRGNSFYFLEDKTKKLRDKIEKALRDVYRKIRDAQLENINEKKKKMFPPDKMTPKQAKEYKKFIDYAKMGIEYKIDMSLFESVNEDGHTDVASSKRKVMIMVDDSNKLLNKLNGMNKEDSLPSWWSDKITLSQNYLEKATNYLLNPVESVNEASLTIPQYKTSIKKLSHSQQDKLFDLLHKLKLMKLIDFINYRDGSLHIAKSSITPKIKKDIEKKFKISLKESVNEARLDPKQLLQQLGGNRFIAMTGAKNLAIDKPKNELHMKIGRNAKGVSHVRIRLTSMDLYDMEFLQVRAGRIKIKSKEKGVYADQLGKMFKKNTGMNVRL